MVTKRNRIALKKASVTALVFFTLDWIFHPNFTTSLVFTEPPFETGTYFIFLAIIAFIISYFLFNREKVEFKHIMVAGVVAGVVKGLYYRAVEILQNQPTFSRVPYIFGVSIRENFILAGMIWLLTHGSFFVIGAYVAHKSISR